MSFRELDKNGDGSLDVTEVKNMFLQSKYFRKHFNSILKSQEPLETIIGSFLDWFWEVTDLDKDGTISMEELKTGLAKLKKGDYGAQILKSQM